MSSDDELIDLSSLGTAGARELLARAAPADVDAARREFKNRVETESGPPAQRLPIPIKILISGGPGAGKTTMVAALSETALQTVETTASPGPLGIEDAGSGGPSTTVAIDFGRVTLDESTILYLFGFQAQDRSSSVWDDLTDGALGAVVLVDPSQPKDCFSALHYFQSIQLPCVVAVNQFADRPTMSLEAVRTAIDVDVPVMAVDTRSREEVKAVVIAVLQRIFARAGHSD